MCNAMDKIVLLKSRQTSINMDKFTQQLTKERDDVTHKSKIYGSEPI